VQTAQAGRAYENAEGKAGGGSGGEKINGK